MPTKTFPSLSWIGAAALATLAGCATAPAGPASIATAPAPSAATTPASPATTAPAAKAAAPATATAPVVPPVAAGGRPVVNRVGHAFIKRTMRERDAIFGGEVTGHYYFRDNFYADNGFIPALLILELMSKKGLSLRDLLKPLRERYFISGEINTRVASMTEVPAKLATLKREYGHGHTYEIDGLSVEFADWHFNVRASNTEPLLRLNLEAETPELMERRRDEVLSIIRN